MMLSPDARFLTNMHQNNKFNFGCGRRGSLLRSPDPLALGRGLAAPGGGEVWGRVRCPNPKTSHSAFLASILACAVPFWKRSGTRGEGSVLTVLDTLKTAEKSFERAKFSHSLGCCKAKEAFSFRGIATLTPDQGLCPWTPLVTSAPDPRYRLPLSARHAAPLFLIPGSASGIRGGGGGGGD